MSKSISITCCKKCPHFSPFPADYFEGDCANRDVPKGQDSRVVNEDVVARWCPL